MREDLICCWLTAKTVFGPYCQLSYWRDCMLGCFAGVLRFLLVFGVLGIGAIPFICSLAFFNQASRSSFDNHGVLLGVATGCIFASAIFGFFWIGTAINLISTFQQIKYSRRS